MDPLSALDGLFAQVTTLVILVVFVIFVVELVRDIIPEWIRDSQRRRKLREIREQQEGYVKPPRQRLLFRDHSRDHPRENEPDSEDEGQLRDDSLNEQGYEGKYPGPKASDTSSDKPVWRPGRPPQRY